MKNQATSSAWPLDFLAELENNRRGTDDEKLLYPWKYHRKKPFTVKHEGYGMVAILSQILLPDILKLGYNVLCMDLDIIWVFCFFFFFSQRGH